VRTSTTLAALYASIRAGETELGPDLDTFGGEHPADTSEIWSWDATHQIVGTCASDVACEARTDAPVGAVALKYADPTEGARWIYDEDEADEIALIDPSLIVRVERVAEATS